MCCVWCHLDDVCVALHPNGDAASKPISAVVLGVASGAPCPMLRSGSTL